MKKAFVILAAGKGERLGGEAKQFRILGSRPLWRWSFDLALNLKNMGMVDDIVIVVPPECTKLLSLPPDEVIVTSGGSSRSLSVMAALQATDADIVLLHDAARPFLDEEICHRLLEAAKCGGAVIPLLPEPNALKRVNSFGITAVDRDELYITQTPQLFPRRELLKMLEAAGQYTFKDEAELWLSHGRKLSWVQGDSRNFKVTDQGDWNMALNLADDHWQYRSGIGYDVHPLIPGRALIIGGVKIPSPLGAAGHSDADALCHAVTDAILSAAGLPDIGTLYPASDERYEGICSTLLLVDALNKASISGWSVDFVSAVLTLQTPRLASWKEDIVRSMEKILGPGRFNVTFKSGEYIPPVGSGQAVVVWATAELRRPNTLRI